MRFNGSIPVAVISLALAACGATPAPRIGPAAEAPIDSLGQLDYSTQIDPVYRLRPSDTVAITVFREPELSLEKVTIAADGTISVPLAGSIMADGRTTAEIEHEIVEALRGAGLKRPIATVNIVEYASHLVTVEGGVEEPGVYPFQPGARLSSAIALANGPSRVSRLNEVVVFRQVDGGTAVALFDYRAVRQGTMLDPVIQPGDRVVVGISSLSQFWQDLIRALPAFGLFTNI